LVPSGPAPFVGGAGAAMAPLTVSAATRPRLAAGIVAGFIVVEPVGSGVARSGIEGAVAKALARSGATSFGFSEAATASGCAVTAAEGAGTVTGAGTMKGRSTASVATAVASGNACWSAAAWTTSASVFSEIFLGPWPTASGGEQDVGASAAAARGAGGRSSRALLGSAASVAEERSGRSRTSFREACVRGSAGRAAGSSRVVSSDDAKYWSSARSGRAAGRGRGAGVETMDGDGLETGMRPIGELFARAGASRGPGGSGGLSH
jgi:hypothetical protein